MGLRFMLDRSVRRRAFRTILLVCTALAVVPGRADLVTTRDGQSLEGIIREENKFYLTIDVRGVTIPIPRERIKEVTRATLDENVRSLLDRALEARSRDELVTARTLIEQARGLNSRNADLIENLRQQDKELTDLERRGGTPEARRNRAKLMLARAVESYDKVRIDEANALLLQALKADPTYAEAQRKMAEQLTQRDPDLEMAAEYFVDSVYPDNLTSDNPVIALLPRIYYQLADRFDQSLDVPKAQRYAELLIAIHKAFQEKPELAAKADEKEAALIKLPVEQMLAERVDHNLAAGNAEFALRKLKGWADPQSSPQMALLFVRAQVGAGDFIEAADKARAASDAFPEDTTLVAHKNALKKMVDAQTALKLGNATEAEQNYSEVFAARGGLAKEVGDAAGRELAELKFKQLQALPPNTAITGYQIADTAAHVLSFSPNRDHQRRAAEVLVQALPRIPWALDFKVFADNAAVTIDPALKTTAEQALARPFNIAFDDASPFKLDLTLRFAVPQTSATQIAAALAPSAPGLAAPYMTPGIGFSVAGTHPSFGTLISQSWNAQEEAMPPAIVTAMQAAGVNMAPDQPKVYGSVQNAQMLGIFVQHLLPEYMLAHLGLLNSRVQIPKVQELLGPAAVR